MKFVIKTALVLFLTTLLFGGVVNANYDKKTPLNKEKIVLVVKEPSKGITIPKDPSKTKK